MSTSPFVAGRENLWKMHLEEVAGKLKKRSFTPHIVENLDAARTLVMDTLLPQTGAKSVSFGGSMTVREAGLLEAVQAKAATGAISMIDTISPNLSREEMMENRRQALLCDFYLCSVNALSMDGILLLTDGFGNRTAAVQFGPRQVVFLVGRNKLCASVQAGLDRISNMAAPANSLRLSKNTPCTKTGHCGDCLSPESICSYTISIRRDPFPGRIHVVLINEEVGF